MPDTSYLLSWMNTTHPSEWIKTTLPEFELKEWKWHTLPPSPMDPRIDMTPYATFYFLMGAVFFLGTACMLLPRKNDRTIDGIATMSDFTKTSLRRQLDEMDKPYNRELQSIIDSNGMEFGELVNRMLGITKRTRRQVFSS